VNELGSLDTRRSVAIYVFAPQVEAVRQTTRILPRVSGSLEHAVRATIQDDFACPKCRSPLAATPDRYSCTACGATFPIVGGIPRFVADLPSDVVQVQGAFDFEHRRFDRSRLTQFHPGLVDQFLADSRITPEFFQGKRVLDAGCGSGRWSYALAHLGAELTAVDLTAGGVESTFGELGSLPNVRIAQANIFELPFRDAQFDFVMSWGVLHHTPSTRAAFDRLVPLVKPGGTLYVMVYETNPRLMTAGTETMRFFLRRMSNERRYDFCRHLVIDTRRHPRLINTLSKFLMVAAYDPVSSPVDAESYQFGLFDAYSPRWNFTHSRDEVSEWFRESGFVDVTVVDSQHGAVKVRGTRRKVDEQPRTRRSSEAARAPTKDPNVEQSPELDWVARFAATHGRPLRVLHVGNIANNAFLNARVQRRAGIEADVVSFDYYHVMGTPEWEEANFSGSVDEFLPDWASVDLGGYERPPWFVQGPTTACIDYLLALRGGRGDPARYWDRLQREVWVLTRRSPAADLARSGRLLKKAIRRPRTAALHLALLGAPLMRYRPVAHGVFWARIASRKSKGLTRAARDVAHGSGVRRALAAHVFPTRLGGAVASQPEEPIHRDEIASATDLTAPAASPPPVVAPSPPPFSDDRDPVVALFRRRFPTRADQLTPSDYEGWRRAAELWREVFEMYDVIQAYATYPIMPMLLGLENYAAYEHGTLRDIPFEDSAVGRTTALGYREAPAVFVTNADDLEAAARLGIPDERVIALPHAVDTRRLFDFAAANATLAPAPESQLTFFAPARHDWVEGFRSQLKGNDRIVRALRLLRDEGDRALVVFVDWGRHVDDTKRLVDDLGLADSVAWIDPLRKEALWRRYLTSHAVLDQFVMEAIGGVAFEAMALGCRVITSLDGAVNARFFGEAPPVLVAASPEEIAAAMKRVANDPFDEDGVGIAARSWVERYHSSERIVALQVAAYRRVLTDGA
jgi:glycosyltransferase involved in cell wall biosynthesis/SAM-dependent methyltransferase